MFLSPAPFHPLLFAASPQPTKTSGSIAKADNSGTAVTTSAGTLKSTSLALCRGGVCPTISSCYDSRDPDTKGACYRETSSHLSTRFQNDLSWREKMEDSISLLITWINPASQMEWSWQHVTCKKIHVRVPPILRFTNRKNLGEP